MPTPIFNGLILDLSKQIFDQRSAIGESDANHDYTEALLALALNRGVRDFLTALIEKETVETIVKAVPEYVSEGSIVMLGGIGDMPSDAIKGLRVVYPIVGSELLAIYTSPEKWYALRTDYNKEETTGNARWTEFSRQVRIWGANPVSITYLYIKNHIDIVINDSTDLLLNQRYFNQLLDIASAYIEKLTPVK